MRLIFFMFGCLLLLACNNAAKKKEMGKEDTARQLPGVMEPVIADTNRPIEAPVPGIPDTVFTALGTEPFWALYVIADDKIIFHPANGEDVEVPYVLPATPDASHSSYHSARGNALIELKIRKAKCSDGMSEEIYPFSVELLVNKMRYSGCGTTE